MLFDQMRAVALSDSRGSGELGVNPKFQRFACHWDFRPRTCRPRTKGTVERPVDRFEWDERSALKPLANQPYLRVGTSPAVLSERRPLAAVKVHAGR